MTYPAISTPLLQGGMAQLRSIRTRGGTVRSITRCRANFSRSPEGEVALSPRRFDTPPISPVCFQQAPDKGGCLLGYESGLSHPARSEEHTSELQSLMRTPY